MNSKLSFFKMGFFVLVALNIVLIFLVLRPHGPGRMGPPSSDKIINRLDKVLELDANQKKQLEALFVLHEKQKDSIFQNSDAIREKMMNCLYNNLPCDSLWANSKNSSNFEKLMFDHHRRILNILNDKQQTLYLDELKSKKQRGPKGPPHF